MKLTFNQGHHTLYVPRCWWHWLLNSSVTTPVKMYTSLKYKFFYWTLLFVIVSSDLVVYLHTNLYLICSHWTERRVVEGKDKDVGCVSWWYGFEQQCWVGNVIIYVSNLVVTKLVLVVWLNLYHHHVNVLSFKFSILYV